MLNCYAIIANQPMRNYPHPFLTRLQWSVLLVGISLRAATAQTTAFTYQGRLADGGNPANGVYALQFSVFDGPTNGMQLGGSFTITNCAVTNGLLTATLDFGNGVFTGLDRWLQIGVRLDVSTNAFIMLSPLQRITPVPYAMYTALAGSVATGTISSAQMAPNAVGSINLQSNAITSSKIAAGQIVKSLNGLRDDVVLVPGSGLSLNTSGNVLQLSADVGSYWNVNGNSGTTSNQFLGTTDNTPLELHVNGARALRLEPTTNSPNLIGGYVGNSISAGVYGATISGGGRIGMVNIIAANHGAIGGGYSNSLASGSWEGTIGGGAYNRILTKSIDCTIAGGWNNSIGTNSFTSVISGGAGNVIGDNADDSFIAGGRLNVIQNGASASAISGGPFNTIGSNSIGGTIAGGWANAIAANASRSTVGGGYLNTNNSPQATIGGGVYNIIQTNASSATIAGGTGNSAAANNAAIIGGNNNTAAGDTSTIGGGYLNIASGASSFIGGGNQNQATNFADTVSGGFLNNANGGTSFVGGGYQNNASGFRAAIAGGMGNSATGDTSFIGAGNNNTARTNSFIGAGYANMAAQNSVVGGGNGNTASGQYSVVPGGYSNAAANNFSFAAGRRAKANHQGAFVWGDSTDADVSSTTNNQFVVRASGGVILYSDPTSAYGVYLPPGGGSFSSLSDRNAKTNVLLVNARDVLDQLVAIPIATWNYRSQSDSVHHMGPMAQDFAAAFGLGEDARHISTVDADGVALAAIQGLNQKLQEELKKRDADNAELKARLEVMERRIAQPSEK